MSDITAQVAIQRVTDTLYAPFRYSGAGLPEGVQVSDPGWIYRDTTYGTGLWFKKTGTAATGWKAMGGTLFSNTTQAGNTAATETTLQTNTIYGGTLAENGDAIEFEYVGAVLVEAGFRTVKVKFGGTTILSSIVSPSVSTTPFLVRGSLIRASATSVLGTAEIIYTYNAAIDPIAEIQRAAITATLSSDQGLVITGTSTTANYALKYSGRGMLVPTT